MKFKRFKKRCLLTAVLLFTAAGVTAQGFEDDVNDEPIAAINSLIGVGITTGVAAGFIILRKRQASA